MEKFYRVALGGHTLTLMRFTHREGWGVFAVDNPGDKPVCVAHGADNQSAAEALRDAAERLIEQTKIG